MSLCPCLNGSHTRTGLTKTVLVFSISVCTNSTVSIGTLQGLENIGLSRISCYSPLHWF